MDQVPAPAMPVEAKTKSNCLMLSFIFSIVVIVILLIVIAVLLFANPFTKTSTQSSSDDSTPVSLQVDNTGSQNVVPTTTLVEGITLSAEVPENWSFVEYSDNTGMRYAVDGVSYAGVTGFDILKNGSVFFSLRGADGIGGGPCTEVNTFADTDPAYVTQLTTDLNDATGEALTVNDLTGQVYSDVNLLDINIRRIGTTYYLNKSVDNVHFNAGCGVEAGIWGLTDIGFTANGAASYGGFSAYSWKITPVNPSADDLNTLDEILGSLQVM